MRISLSSTGVILAISLGLACRPKSGPLLVAYVSGDVYLPRIETEYWAPGKTVECYLASGTSFPLDKKGDLLLCGTSAEIAWNASWLRSDIKTNLYDAAQRETVRFQSMGHGGGRYGPTKWFCTRMQSEIECK
jgi:hypothetical protein